MFPEKLTRAAMLYDFYGQLLTEKQQNFWELYYHQDLSLGEIAEEFSVSRQAVFDLLKRTERILLEYEDKLVLVSKYMQEREKIEQVIQTLNNIKEFGNLNKIDDVVRELQGLVE